MFVSFEGVDGSGKTTQARLLGEHLRSQGRDVLEIREPGGTPLGERVRDLLLGADPIVPWAEAALFTAARAQLVGETVRPALERGADVVADRYIDSSLAYQGLARGLGVERVLEMNLVAVGGLLPDRTFFLSVPVEEAVRRRGHGSDRIEGEGDDFIASVDGAYRELAAVFANRIFVVDATRAPEEVAAEIRGRVRDLS